MLEKILAYCNNWFIVPDGIHTGEFTIKDGGITLPFLADGQYFRIVGSVLNDGLYQYPASAAELTDETFDGTIWALAIPKAVLGLSEDVTAWQDQYGGAAGSPYQSESFGGYSYTKATTSTGAAVSWENQFANELQRWRKLGNAAGR